MASTKQQVSALLAALRADDPSNITKWLSQHRTKTGAAELASLVKSWPAKQKAQLDDALAAKVDATIARYHESAEQALAGSATPGSDPEIIKEDASHALQAMSWFLKIITEQAPQQLSEPLRNTIVALHDNALLAAGDDLDLQEHVSSLCAAYWQKQLPSRELLVVQTVPFLLVRALLTQKAADVKRVFAMRQGLALLDYQDASSDDIKRLMLRAMFSPVFLRVSEGRRFLAYLFTLDVSFIAELMAVIRNQVPSGRRPVLEAYGDVLFRAWRDAASTPCAYAVEHDAIQDLMLSAIHAAIPEMASNLRSVLSGLHKQKACAGVDSLLCRLYEPILLRACTAPNVGVRTNALELLADAFPLNDPEASVEDNDALLAQQFSLLAGALQDTVPTVRVAAVHAVLRVLDKYWELVPPGETASLAKMIFGKLAFDGTSPAVRAAVLQGALKLLDNPLAQPILKATLPNLGQLAFDPSLKVRTTLLDILHAVRCVRDVHYWELVPLDALLQLIATDTNAVSSKIQALLLPSFFPNLEEGPAFVVALLRKHPMAGVAFCGLLAGEVSKRALPEGAPVELAVALQTHLLHCEIVGGGGALEETGGPSTSAGVGKQRGGKKGTKRKGGHRGRNEEEQGDAAHPGGEEDDDDSSKETPASWEAIATALAALLHTMGTTDASQLPFYQHPDNLTGMLTRAPTPAATQAILDIAAVVPTSTAAQGVTTWCAQELMRGVVLSCATPQLLGMLRCLMAGGLRGALVHLLACSLGGEDAGVRVREAMRNVEVEVDGVLRGVIAPADALRCLHVLITDPTLLTTLLTTNTMPILADGAFLVARVCVDRCCQALEQGQGGVEEEEGCMLEAVMVAARALLHSCVHGEEALQGIVEAQQAAMPLTEAPWLQGVQDIVNMQAALSTVLASTTAWQGASTTTTTTAATTKNKRRKGTTTTTAAQTTTRPAAASGLEVLTTLTALLADVAALRLCGLVTTPDDVKRACGGIQDTLKACGTALHAGEATSTITIPAVAHATRLLAHAAESATFAPEQLPADTADAFGVAASQVIKYVATHAEDSTVGSTTLRAVATKHLPALLGHAAAAAPLAVACSSHRWLTPIAARALETQGAAEGGDTTQGATQGDPLRGALLKAPQGTALATALAEEAGAAMAHEDPEGALGAVLLLQALRVRQLPPAALAALLPLVDTSGEPDGVGGALQRALESVVPVDTSLSALQLVVEG